MYILNKQSISEYLVIHVLYITKASETFDFMDYILFKVRILSMK